jgi:hypothetical protein
LKPGRLLEKDGPATHLFAQGKTAIEEAGFQVASLLLITCEVLCL